MVSRREISVRALVRNEAKAGPLQDAGAALAIGSFEDAQALQTATDGIDTVVLITAVGPDAATQASAVLSMAKDAGVRRIVRISANQADPEGPTANTRLHGKTDNEIISSGLTHAILRLNRVMQNFLGLVDEIRRTGKIRSGHGNGKIGMIDLRDVVDCAEAVVLSDEFTNQIFELTGPESLSFVDVARTLSAVLGRPIEYVAVSPEAVEKSLTSRGLSAWQARVIRDYNEAHSIGWSDFTTDAVERICGHPPRSLAQFATEVFAPAFVSAL